MKELIKSASLFLVLVFALSACENEGYSEKIIGTWEASIFVDSKKARTVFDMEDTDGMEMEMTSNLKTTYLRGNRYNAEGDVTFRIKANGQEMPLKLHMVESGSYEFHDNFLISITDDSKITAADEMTRNAIKNAPEFAELIQPVKGASTSTEIIEMSETSMQTKTEDLPGLLITSTKK
ncbi:MAG: hypothetical protein AB8B74_03770 [Crocinitomicaceae bacterium]